MKLSDETLMAFADGELDPAQTAAVALEVQADPTLAAKIAIFRHSREVVARAFTKPATSPDPDPIAERIKSLAAERAAPPAAGNVINLSSRRHVPFWQVPLAAAIMLAVGLAAGTLAFRAPGSGGMGTAILDDPGLFPALASLPSGNRKGLASGAEVALIATFRNGDGGLCREFEYDLPTGLTTVAVACRAEGDWDVQLAIAADAGASGFAPASSLEALDAWLAATGTEPPMSAAEEVAALAGANAP